MEGFLPGTDGPTQSFTVINTVCDGLSVEALAISSSKPTDDTVLLPLNLDQFGITCNGDLEFELSQLSGSASFSVNVTATADIVFAFMSDDFSTLPPAGTALDSCGAELETNSATLSNLMVDGLPDFLIGTLLSFVDGLLGTIIGEQGETCTLLKHRLVLSISECSLQFLFAVICNAVNDTSFLTNLINQVSVPLRDNLPPRDPVNPLSVEESFNSSEVLLDFTGSQTSPVDFFATIITGPILNPTFVVSNIISGLLNNDSAVVLDGGALGLGNALTFETDFAVINATLGDISIFGLDSLSELGERVVLGNYTLGSSFKFDQISIVADLDLEIVPQNNEDALIGFNSEPILETVQLSWSTSHFAGNFSLFIALVVDDFAVVPPASLLGDPGSVLPCLLASLAGLQLPQLEFTFDFVNPIITGFSSSGTAWLARGFTEALFLMFGPSITLAMPGISQNEFLPLLNDLLNGAIEGEQNCPFQQEETEAPGSSNETTRFI